MSALVHECQHFIPSFADVPWDVQGRRKHFRIVGASNIGPAKTGAAGPAPPALMSVGGGGVGD